ncbi:MAG: PAS domain S-box protein, partial [Euryarchaeota archaeon]|nr:PAS domain S-box protein [Euryarchaeota archaeon]
ELIELKKQGVSGQEVLDKYEDYEEAETDFLKVVDRALLNEETVFSNQRINLENAISDAKYFILLFSLLAFALAIISWAISNYFSTPNVNLKDAAQDNVKEKSGAQVYIRTNDEIGELAAAFNRMSGDLKNSLTEQERMNKRLRNSEARFIAMFDKAVIGIYLSDLDGCILDSNPAFMKMIGYSAEEVRGKKFIDYTYPEDVSPNLLLFNEAITGKRDHYIMEKRYVRKDGTILWGRLAVSVVNSAEGGPQFLIAMMEDITESKKAEDALRESEEKYRSLVESTDDSIYMVDRDGRYLFMNSKHLLRLGIQDYRGKSYKDIHSPDRIKVFTERVSSVFENGEPQHCEYESNGKWFHQTLSPVKNPRTGIVTAVASVNVVSNDITVRKKAERMILENERLASASRAKSQFLSNMSHELRTPLNSIIGFSELLRQKVCNEEKHMQYVQNVLTSGRHLLNIINDILDLSKVEAGKIDLIFEDMNVADTIYETTGLVCEMAKKRNVVIKTDIDQELGTIEADPQRFRQILFNLLSNAVKFSKKDGGMVTSAAKKEGDMAKFQVVDTGIGINEEDVDRLFEKFDQLDSGITKNYGGTGLGLAISKKLVGLQGGEIKAESIYGEGSTFTFTLPIASTRSKTSKFLPGK